MGQGERLAELEAADDAAEALVVATRDAIAPFVVGDEPLPGALVKAHNDALAAARVAHKAYMDEFLRTVPA